MTSPMRRGPRSSRSRVNLYQRDERALLAPVLLLAAVFPAFPQQIFDSSRVIKAVPCCLLSLNPAGADIDAFDDAFDKPGRRLFHAEVTFESASSVTLLDATSQGSNIVVSGIAYAGTLRREFVAFLSSAGQVVHVIPMPQFEPRAVCVGAEQTLWVAGQPMRKERGIEAAVLRHYRFDGKVIREYLREPVGGTPRLVCMGENVAVALPGAGEWVEVNARSGVSRRVRLPGTGEATGAAAVPGSVLVSVGTKLYRMGLADESWVEIPAPADFGRLIGPGLYLSRGGQVRALAGR